MIVKRVIKTEKLHQNLLFYCGNVKSRRNETEKKIIIKIVITQTGVNQALNEHEMSFKK